MKADQVRFWPLVVSILLVLTVNVQAEEKTKKKVKKPDIRKLSQHFIDKEDTSPWMFVPEENVGSISLAERPGLAVVRHAGKGMDVKGILKDPIKIDDYPLPWEFHLGFAQVKSSEIPFQTSNYAVGINIAVTFSDPSEWPEDRTKQPPDTHSFQLFVAHIKAASIERGPLNWDDHSSPHEIYRVFGRGDMGGDANGDWEIPYIWTSDRQSGPADFLLRFRLMMDGPSSIQVGFHGGLTGEPHVGYRHKSLNVAQYGKITGIWEIGPIISQDRWIPDELAPALGIPEDVEISPPDPVFPAWVDYCTFFGRGPKTIEHASDFFDIPGYQAKWYHEGGAILDTYSNPGFLTVTMQPASLDGWAMCPTAIGTKITLADHDPFPGYEVEARFYPPDDSLPWNLFISSFVIWDENNQPFAGGWQPGVQNFPEEDRHKFINDYSGPNQPTQDAGIQMEFEEEIPESILGNSPLHMILQVTDNSHLRMGFRGDPGDPWYWSKPYDTTQKFGKIGAVMAHPCLVWLHTWPVPPKDSWTGYGVGNYPGYGRLLVDYVDFRFGCSE